jgi:hypothetical protein
VAENVLQTSSCTSRLGQKCPYRSLWGASPNEEHIRTTNGAEAFHRHWIDMYALECLPAYRGPSRLFLGCSQC